MNQVNSQFEQILLAAKERRGDLSVDSMIVSSHLSQMRMFMLRKGLEFYAEQDSFGYRKEFIKRVVDHNMLEMKLDSIVDYFLCDGQGLFYFRPSGDDYQLLFFPKDNYRAYRDQNGDLENIVLIYTFNVQETNVLDTYARSDGKGGKKKYIRLKVFRDRIEQTISNEKIDFENEMGAQINNMAGHTETLTNSLGFIPAVEVFNHMDCTGEATGNGEFDWLANQILYHDELVRNVRKNLKFFGNPTLLSSRPKHDIIESGDEGSFRPTISSQAGFAAIGRSSTRVSEPFGGASALDGQIKVPRVIANLEPTDRVNYLTPDSVSGDQNMYIKQYRSEIRLALGGVDDIDINTASTAYEMKSLYGRCAATAEKKAKALFTYGLCQLFGLMIQHEEKMFKESFALAIGLKKPVVPLEEEYQDPKEFEAAQEKYMTAMQKFTQKREQEIRATLDGGVMPPGVTGLIPDGSTKVDWRWMGDIFEDDAQDILNNSIVVRNLQELGVDSIEALKYLFPSKTDEERAAMLSGYPFRMVQQTQQSLNSFIGLLGQLYQLPHPQTPELPLASDPNLDITGFLYRSLDFLRKELSYSGKYNPDSSDERPQASAPQMSAAPQADSQYATNASPASQAYQVQVPQMPQAPAYQGQAPAAQASAPQGNPWQQAFQALSASLNTSNQYQAQVSPSAYQVTPTPQAATQASWASMPQAPQQQAQYSAQQTYSPQASTQALMQQALQQQVAAPAPALAESQAPARDAYLSQISDESLEVLEHFGAEAPHLLNTYACAVEDALIEQVQRGQHQSLVLEAAGEERSAMNLMLTDPDVLADYVNDFFGPEGPYPTLTEAEQYELANEQARAQFEQEIIAQEQGQVPQNFQRPVQEMPTPGRQANAANDFWGGFSEMMDANPEDAWKVLSQAPPAAFQQKMMIQDL